MKIEKKVREVIAVLDGEKYWYEYFYSECVVCGKCKYNKERRFGVPPPKPKRAHYEQYACGEHFC